MFWIIIPLILSCFVVAILLLDYFEFGDDAKVVVGLLFVFALLIMLVGAPVSSFVGPSKSTVKRQQHEVNLLVKSKSSLNDKEYWEAFVRKNDRLKELKTQRSKNISAYNFWFVLPWNQ